MAASTTSSIMKSRVTKSRRFDQASGLRAAMKTAPSISPQVQVIAVSSGKGAWGKPMW